MKKVHDRTATVADRKVKRSVAYEQAVQTIGAGARYTQLLRPKQIHYDNALPRIPIQHEARIVDYRECRQLWGLHSRYVRFMCPDHDSILKGSKSLPT